jgi:uncharacterized oxidoreductase
MQALRFQLWDTTTQVIELIPPGVVTDLMPGASSDPHMMPLNEFIAESMNLLKMQPSATEICVERVKFLRYAAEGGQFDTVFNTVNQRSF